MASNRQIRTLQRTIHLVCAAGLAAHLYSPFGNDPGFVWVTRTILFPVLAVSGLLLWQFGRLKRWLAGQSARV